MWLIEPRDKQGHPSGLLWSGYPPPEPGPPPEAAGTGLLNWLPNGAVAVAPLSEVEPNGLAGDDAVINEAYRWSPVVHLRAGRYYELTGPVHVPARGKIYLQDAAVDRALIELGEGACIVDDCQPNGGGGGGGGFPLGFRFDLPYQPGYSVANPAYDLFQIAGKDIQVPQGADLALYSVTAFVDGNTSGAIWFSVGAGEHVYGANLEATIDRPESTVPVHGTWADTVQPGDPLRFLVSHSGGMTQSWYYQSYMSVVWLTAMQGSDILPVAVAKKRAQEKPKPKPEPKPKAGKK